MEDLTAKLKAFWQKSVLKDEDGHWAAKGQGKRLGGAGQQGAASPSGVPASSSQRAQPAVPSPQQQQQQQKQTRQQGGSSAPAPTAQVPGTGSRNSSSSNGGLDVPLLHGPLRVNTEMPAAKVDAELPQAITPPPQPLASPADRVSRMSSTTSMPGQQPHPPSSSSEAQLPNGQPLLMNSRSRGRHLYATDVVQQAVLQSVVMANTPTGAECAVLGAHLALRDMRQVETESPPQLRVAAGAINTPTAAERTLGLSGAWHPDPHQDFHLQQCLALIVSHEEAQARGCLTTLHRVLHNIIQEPGRPKLRTLRLSNPTIQSNVVQVRGALEFLDAAGFLTLMQPASAPPPSPTMQPRAPLPVTLPQQQQPADSTTQPELNAAADAEGRVQPAGVQLSLPPDDVLGAEAAASPSAASPPAIVPDGAHGPAASQEEGPPSADVNTGLSPGGAPGVVSAASPRSSSPGRGPAVPPTGAGAQLGHSSSAKSTRSLQSTGALSGKSVQDGVGAVAGAGAGPGGSAAKYLAASGGEEGGAQSPGSAVRAMRGDGERSTHLQRRLDSQRRASNSSSSSRPSRNSNNFAAAAAAAVRAVGEVAGLVPGSGAGLPAGELGVSAEGPDTVADASDELLEGYLVLPEEASLHPVMVGLHELAGVMRVMGLEPSSSTADALSQDRSPARLPSSFMYDKEEGAVGETTWSPLIDSPTPATPSQASPQAAAASATAAAAARMTASGSPTSGSSAQATGAAAQRSPVAQPRRPPAERLTQVVLPVAPDMQDVPDWFFERTAAELKTEVAALVRKRAAGEVLTTRAWRERMQQQQQSAGGAGSSRQPEITTLRIRFPEGVYLQGCFGAWEPTTAVFEWVTESLRYPDVPYELVVPGSRRPLGSSGVLRAVKELWPAAVLNLRPLGLPDGAAVGTVPLLSDALLAATLLE